MSTFAESKRMPGSEWLKNRPRLLEAVYATSKSTLQFLYPLLRRVTPAGWRKRIFVWSEEVSKGYLFNCQMCGQCILHSTGMTCPMNCPKNLRNGPCGGVRQNGHCEVIPEMPCVWAQAWRRDALMGRYGGEVMELQPPVNRGLQNSSAWLNLLDGVDVEQPPGWSTIELDETEST